jgi:uncharacterized membrane protein YedE/YeeE
VKTLISSLFSGLFFGLGLVVSGMTEPEKVKGFLDFFGAWDPSLLFVMVGAIGVHMPIYAYLKRNRRVFEVATNPAPPKLRIDGKLILGAALFGTGWGLGGYCPGPAIASMATGGDVLVVVFAIVIGIGVHDWAFARKRALSDPDLRHREDASTA